jgi:hypothetical protein
MLHALRRIIPNVFGSSLTYSDRPGGLQEAPGGPPARGDRAAVEQGVLIAEAVPAETALPGEQL